MVCYAIFSEAHFCIPELLCELVSHDITMEDCITLLNHIVAVFGSSLSCAVASNLLLKQITVFLGLQSLAANTKASPR